MITLNELIEQHNILGHSCGVKLLYVPLANVEIGNKIVLLGLNPGGNVKNKKFEIEFNGCAYIDEIWKSNSSPGASPLQVQIRKLFECIAITQGCAENGDNILRNSVGGNLIPFRSPTWKALASKNESLQQGKIIWNEILDSVKPKLIIGFSGIVKNYLSVRYNCRMKPIPTGWGNYSAYYFRKDKLTVWILPHLSTFKIFSSENCRSFVNYFKSSLDAQQVDSPDCRILSSAKEL